jgi:two-component system OmpR family response regulator
MGREMRVLLVEDSDRLQELLSETLQGASYMVDVVATVSHLFSCVAVIDYDLFIIDLGLPDGEGLDAIRTLRSTGISKPILIITARGSIDDRVRGLDGGADDYLIKPFNHGELLARVRALQRRPDEFQGMVLRRGNTELDQATLEVRCSGRPIELRLSERRLLATLMRRSSGLVPKLAIEEALSNFGRELSANALEAQVSRLRKALSETGSGLSIETIRGVGYRLIEGDDK